MNRGGTGGCIVGWAVNGNAARARGFGSERNACGMPVVRADHLEMVWPRETNLRKEQLITRDELCRKCVCRDEEPEEMPNVNGVADVKRTRLSSAVFRYAVSKHGSWECMRICSPTVMSK